MAMFNLLRINRIRHLLTEDACHTLVRGLVLSHLDYCNAGLPNTDIDRIQNSASKLVKNFDRYDSPTKALKELHWLPIRDRIQHKILSLVFNCHAGTAPKYLQDLLTPASTVRSGLRSNQDTSSIV